jgi:hypothetical protein
MQNIVGNFPARLDFGRNGEGGVKKSRGGAVV